MRPHTYWLTTRSSLALLIHATDLILMAICCQQPTATTDNANDHTANIGVCAPAISLAAPIAAASQPANHSR